MRVLLSFSWGSCEARKIIDLPQGLSPQVGMIIHTTNDIDFRVAAIDVSIDKLHSHHDPHDPAVILLLESREGSYDSRPTGEALFKDACSILADSGWDVP